MGALAREQRKHRRGRGRGGAEVAVPDGGVDGAECGPLHTLVHGEQPPETVGGVRLIAVEAHRCILPFEAQSVVAGETRPANRGLCAGDGLLGANARNDGAKQRPWISRAVEDGPQQRRAKRGRDAIGLALRSGLVEKPPRGRGAAPRRRLDPQIVPVLDDATRECSQGVDVPQAHRELEVLEQVPNLLLPPSQFFLSFAPHPSLPALLACSGGGGVWTSRTMGRNCVTRR